MQHIDNSIRMLVYLLIAFAVILAIALLAGQIPAWVGAGAQQNPIGAAMLLLSVSGCALALNKGR